MARTRGTLGAFGLLLVGTIAVARWLIFVGPLVRMDHYRIVKKVLDFRSLLERGMRQTLVADNGGGGNSLHHRGRGVRPCIREKVLEQVSDSWQSEDQTP